MKVAVLSGKGGIGKTFVSVNLAASAKNSIYLDCDVEEPNGHLFFRPEKVKCTEVKIKIPDVNNALCDGCLECVNFCAFNALAYVGKKLMIFDELCHSCGGCALLCKSKAISEKEKRIGIIERGISHSTKVVTGILDVGQASGVPIIKQMIGNLADDSSLCFIDCAPGSACAVMETVKEADYCVLVAEPTIFGMHNFKMVEKLVKLFNKPLGVIINKCFEGENQLESYCIDNYINILLKIPFDEELGTINSEGRIVVREKAHYMYLFSDLLAKVYDEVKR